MSFKRKAATKSLDGKIALIKITNGNTYHFDFDPNLGPKGNLARFIREFDDEGYPLFFAESKIAGLPIRVLDADLQNRLDFYVNHQASGKAAASRAPMPAKIAQKAEEITKAVKKATNKKAAGAAKKSKAMPKGEAE